MSTEKLTWGQVVHRRAQRHRLDERASPDEALEIVGDICCLHAQLMSSAELSLWTRIHGVEKHDVERMLWTDRSLVKTWAMRGTLHLLPSDEYQLWQSAMSLRDHYLKGAWLRAFGVTRDELERLIQAVGEALAEDPLTRDQLAVRVGEITKSSKLGDKLRESWGAMLKPASFRGNLCFGPNEGRKVRFTRPDRWLDLETESQPDPAAAQDAITRRFLAAYAPATREDYARWWGITPAAGGKLIAALGDAVTQVDVEGDAAWMPTEDVDASATASLDNSVRLLPAFDPYVIGATLHATKLMPGDFKARVYRSQGWISPVLLVNGRVEGIWRHERKGRRLDVTIEPFVKVPKWARKGAELEAEGLARWFEATLSLAWEEGP